eukprot:COSAG05_NODE_1308_length_5225_cov_3.554233_3_plen_175_part_00
MPSLYSARYALHCCTWVRLKIIGNLETMHDSDIPTFWIISCPITYLQTQRIWLLLADTVLSPCAPHIYMRVYHNIQYMPIVDHRQPGGDERRGGKRVRFHIIRNAHLENVGKSQSCMVSKLRIMYMETDRTRRRRPSAGRGAGESGLPTRRRRRRRGRRVRRGRRASLVRCVCA